MLKSQNIYYTLFCCFLIFCSSCKSDKTQSKLPEVIATSAMKNVMWKGELFGKIQLDTLKKKHHYGVGPQDYLQGELLIIDGETYLSKALSDTTQLVKKTDTISAPFFVHTYVSDWYTEDLPSNIKTIKDLETYIHNRTTHINVPFAFKLEGTIEAAQIHIQNLPQGTRVRSPREAHQGQVKYNLENEEVIIIGFYSENHQGIFTHHDSFLHMHLMTKDETKMGHLDAMTIANLKLSLPKEIIN